MSLDPALVPVEGLVGVWRGEGKGEYPTISPFEYTEELTFTDVGKPFLIYSQRTWSPEGKPMHIETGYLRIIKYETVEFVLAIPTGQTELAEGTIELHDEGFTIDVQSRVLNSTSAKQVDATKRHLRLGADTLTTSFAMAAVGVPMSHHLAATLRRVD